ncbi:MAG TPA: M12 family metallo-peptidase, partial [Acidimicrobiia bacterium]|nr:M12 family metallo-peptidase [Acidimicrobiia bacterium]
MTFVTRIGAGGAAGPGSGRYSYMHPIGGRTHSRILSSIAFVALVAGSIAVAAPPVSADAAPELVAAGRAPLRGAAAIARLGERLDNVAARHHVSDDKLEHMLRSDATLAVDANEQLVYTEPSVVGVEPAPESVPPVSATEDDDTFELHSRPGAPRTIYLDFDGETVTGTGWTGSYTGGSSCYGDAFTTDGDGSTFSSGERAIIKSVWERVSEDYAPFAVDVTTEDPGAAGIQRTNYLDEEFGTRALITSATTVCSNGKTLYQSVCPGGCGGVAWVGVFNYSGWLQDAYQPALVFNNALSNSAKNIAEATSHEVGHNLGLSHDGATTGCGSGGLSACSYYYGQNMWAPIMGVGYNKPVTQWSKGDYSIANNTEDDLAIMQGLELDLRADDHGGDRE